MAKSNGNGKPAVTDKPTAKALRPAFGKPDVNGYRNAKDETAEYTMFPDGHMTVKPSGARHGWTFPNFVTLAKRYATEPAFAALCDEQCDAAAVQTAKKPTATRRSGGLSAEQVAAMRAQGLSDSQILAVALA